MSTLGECLDCFCHLQGPWTELEREMEVSVGAQTRNRDSEGGHHWSRMDVGCGCRLGKWAQELEERARGPGGPGLPRRSWGVAEDWETWARNTTLQASRELGLWRKAWPVESNATQTLGRKEPWESHQMAVTASLTWLLEGECRRTLKQTPDCQVLGCPGQVILLAIPRLVVMRGTSEDERPSSPTRFCSLRREVVWSLCWGRGFREEGLKELEGTRLTTSKENLTLKGKQVGMRGPPNAYAFSLYKILMVSWHSGQGRGPWIQTTRVPMTTSTLTCLCDLRHVT